MTTNEAVPYEGRGYLYVPRENEFMLLAATLVEHHPYHHHHPIGIILVKDGIVIGVGVNGNDYHDLYGCERVKKGIAADGGFEECPGCSYEAHAEPQAISATILNGNDPNGADVYMYGHYWCCQPCWDLMDQAGIRHVYLMEEARRYFDRNSPDYEFSEQSSKIPLVEL